MSECKERERVCVSEERERRRGRRIGDTKK